MRLPRAAALTTASSGSGSGSGSGCGTGAGAGALGAGAGAVAGAAAWAVAPAAASRPVSALGCGAAAAGVPDSIAFPECPGTWICGNGPVLRIGISVIWFSVTGPAIARVCGSGGLTSSSSSSDTYRCRVRSRTKRPSMDTIGGTAAVAW
ncbi:hypothetical protein [Actinomadura madurae]|uniref:hypothetical protein n=1 Tax=Actinomadura madurae TaxID=1993 RepID=UPI0020D20440|nr:hypothetical protein [Actinomadura madurae]MCQ0010777.1 hypothetical protein [Actinomadura madurae]